MSSNKVNAKAKGNDKGKGNSKTIVSNNDENEHSDFSLLRKPIQTSITGFAQARKIFDMATEELRGLLSDECDLLYECKVCRNLFRSLVNFISHKRVFCQSKFNSTVHGHFIKSSSILNELTKIKSIEEGYQDSLKNNNEAKDVDEVDERIPLTKDLTTIVEKITKNRGVTNCTDEDVHVNLHKIPNSAVAVFQNVEVEEKDSENMRTQVKELDDILSRNIAVLQSDGKFKIESSVPEGTAESNTEGVIQISDDEDGGNSDSLKCKKCNTEFSTQKTLKFHMKYKHVDTRVVYPCPDCLDIFSTSWSVYRHLFKVHRKTAAQIRRLRESIQAKAFKMNNPPAFYEKRKNNMKTALPPKITEEERLDQENQAWMDNMECEGSMPRCGGCGRAFERRAALAAHTHTCQPRSRALRRPDTKRIEIQIRKDYHKGPTAQATLLTRATDNKTKEMKDSKEIKEDDNKIELIPKKETDMEEVAEPSGIDEEASRDSEMQFEDEPASKSASVSPEKVDESPKLEPQAVKLGRLPFAQQAEKSNLMALRQRMIPDVDLDTLRCKKCATRCDHIQDMYDHVAKHYNWMRYACKLCNFKHYNFEKLPEHVKIVHKLKGDKDFYFSTVKALDGIEASDLATPVEESAEVDDSANSRRPSRCSSDSSRVSDDSSSSTTRVEGSRKRKMVQREPSKVIGRRRKSFKGSKEADDEWTEKDDTQPYVKTFEDNSSDMDDAYERVGKNRTEISASVASRRPVRRKAKPKNEDFEYDLSNLLKMEAQGYRDSQSVTTTTKSNLPKKKMQPDNLSNYEMLIKESCGALATQSRKAVENAKALMKTAATIYMEKGKIPSSIFVRPLPKTLTRSDKLSPKKDIDEELSQKDGSSSKETLKENTTSILENESSKNNMDAEKKVSIATPETSDNNVDKLYETDSATSSGNTSATQNIETNDSNTVVTERVIHKSISIPAVVPIKLRRQSIEVVQNNTILSKYSSEFTKAGMKRKILVIKPINRNKDGTQTVNCPLKYQTIKLKEMKKINSNEDKSSDQVVVVKVPKVDCINRTGRDSLTKVPQKVSLIKRTDETSAPDETALPDEAQSLNNPPTNIIISNLEKNGDIDVNKVANDVDPIKQSDNVKLKSDVNDSPSIINTCDSNIMKTDSIVKSSLDSSSDDKLENFENVEHAADMA